VSFGSCVVERLIGSRFLSVRQLRRFSVVVFVRVAAVLISRFAASIFAAVLVAVALLRNLETSHLNVLECHIANGDRNSGDANR